MKTLFTLLNLLLLAVMPVSAQETTEANFTDTCVTEYNPEVDYFPAKAAVSDAQNFDVQYFNHYKVVTVSDAFEGADPYEYVLVQCGTPAPDPADFSDDAQFIEVPAGDLIVMSTTVLPGVESLGLIDSLVGLDSLLYTNTPAVVEKIGTGELIEIGGSFNLNVEVALDAEPDIVLSSGFDPDTDAHPVLIDAGIFTALIADWREDTPMARAEWVKYLSLFYNKEAEAEALFDEIVTNYEAARDLAADVPEAERPVVLMNAFSSFTEAWTIPGAQTFVGTLIDDAGGIIALADEAPEDSAFVSFEVVYDQALDADIWLTQLFMVSSIDDLLAQDARYADFNAVAAGQVWNDNLDVNENGGSNAYELGVARPDLLLQDLVAIFHPDLLPEHEIRFYRNLE